MVNGAWTDHLGIRDRGLAYGDGLFETCRWVDGQLPLWSYHESRVLRDAARLFMPIDSRLLAHQQQQFCAELVRLGLLQGAVKLIVTRGQGGAGYTPLAAPSVSLIWQHIHVSQETHLAKQGLRLMKARLPLSTNAQLAGIKHLNRLDYVVAAASQPLSAGEQLLLLDAEGFPIETLHQNIFWVKNRVLCTPQLVSTGVAGVIRQIILERLAPALGLAVAVKRFPLQALLEADEVFVCNSLRGIWPVTQIEEQLWSIGPITEHLQMVEKSLWPIV